jgi:hypothetical protein
MAGELSSVVVGMVGEFSSVVVEMVGEFTHSVLSALWLRGWWVSLPQLCGCGDGG